MQALRNATPDLMACLDSPHACMSHSTHCLPLTGMGRLKKDFMVMHVHAGCSGGAACSHGDVKQGMWLCYVAYHMGTCMPPRPQWVSGTKCRGTMGVSMCVKGLAEVSTAQAKEAAAIGP